ncbi:MAG TPA: hypothetical protein VJB14_07140 [Planctomycetota bacterium]|nr:hypothetical protein [Planctomycetota bacterium]
MMSHGTIVRVLRGLGLAAMAAFLTAESCPKDIGEGDRPGRYTVRVSLDKDGGQVLTPVSPAIGSERSSISGDGRFVAFHSDSPQLAPGDGNGVQDVFVKDRATGAVELVSINTDAAVQSDYVSEDPSISADGRFVAFVSFGDLGGGSYWTLPATRRQLFRYDRLLKVTRAVYAAGGQPNADMYRPSISPDGRYVAFTSSADEFGSLQTIVQTWLADLGDPNGPFTATVFTLISRTTGSPTTGGNGFCDEPRVCVLPGGAPFVVFTCNGDNLVAGTPTDAETRVFGGSPGSVCEMISLTDADVPSNGLCTNPSVSSDGRYVSFSAIATNITGSILTPGLVAVRDRTLGTTTLVSYDSTGAPLTSSFFTSISGDGQSVAFVSRPTTGGFQQVWVKTVGGAIQIASVHLTEAIAADACFLPSLSADGRWVSWNTEATNLVTTDTNGQSDIFVRGPLR